MSTITAMKAHGVTYTREQAEAALDRIAKDNEAYGPSDGRVTLANAITEMLAAESAAQVAKYAAAEERESAERLERNIRRSREELAGMERGTPGIGRIQYVDKKHGKMAVARYTTRDGFLRGYIRMATNPNAYGIMFVDEG